MKVQNKDGKGNPWHSDATGEFTSPGGDGSKNIDAESPSKWSDFDKDKLTEDDLWKQMFEDSDAVDQEPIEQEPVEPLEEEQKEQEEQEEVKEEDGDIEDRTSEEYKKKNKILKQRVLDNLFKASNLKEKGKNFQLFETHFNKWDLSNDFLEATSYVFEKYNIDFILHSGSKCTGGSHLRIGLSEWKENGVEEYRFKNDFLHEMGHVFDRQFRDRDMFALWTSSHFFSDTEKMTLKTAIKEEFDTGKYTSNTIESQAARQTLKKDLAEVLNAYHNYVDTNSIEYTSNMHNPDIQHSVKRYIEELDKLTEGRFSQLRKNIDAKYEDQIKNIRASLTSNADAETYLKNLKDLNDLVADKAMHCNRQFNEFLANEWQRVEVVPDYDFKKEYKDKLKLYMDNFKAYTVFGSFRISRGMVELSPITDVFKGANNGDEIITPGLIHPKSYYKQDNERTQIECVANMVAAIEENNPLTISLLKKYFPKSFTIVKEMVEKEFYKKGDKNEKK